MFSITETKANVSAVLPTVNNHHAGRSHYWNYTHYDMWPNFGKK